MPGFDLHFHSSYSDGKLSVQEIARILIKKNLDFCALSDHNTVIGIRELKKYLKNSPTEVIPATELTTKYGDDEIHILAYDFDIDTVADILEYRNDLVRKEKIEEMQKAVDLFRSAGFCVSSNLSPTEKQPVGLTVALDVHSHAKNQEVFQKEHGKMFSLDDIYYEYQAPGKACAVERAGVTVGWVVEQFKDIAKDLIVAHPFVPVSVVVKPLSEVTIQNLIQLGISGVEVYHNKTTLQQINSLENLVQANGLHYTGGSDSHGKVGKDTPLGQYNENKKLERFQLTNYQMQE